MTAQPDDTLERRLTRLVGPPSEITLYFCLECGRQITGTYNIDSRRKKCSKLWHRDGARPVRYRKVGSSVKE